MPAIRVVLGKELRESVRERRPLLTALLFGPIFGALLLSVMVSLVVSRSARDTLAPVELTVSHAERAPHLLEQLGQHAVTIERADLDDAGARRTVASGRHKLVLQVPEDYPTQIAAGAPAPLLLYTDSSDSASARDVARVRVLLAQYDMLLGRLRLLARGIDPLTVSPLAVQDIDVATPASRSVLVLGIVSYLLLFATLMGGLYLAIDATAGERERGSLEPLLTTPVRREELIYGKVLAACVLMLLSLAVTAFALTVALRHTGLESIGMSANLDARSALLIFLCCAPIAPLGAALMTIVAAFTRTYREAQTYLGLLMLVPTLPLAFASLLSLRPTAWLMTVPSLSQHFLIQSVLRAEPIRPGYALTSAGVTLLLGAALTLIAGRLYRREALLG